MHTCTCIHYILYTHSRIHTHIITLLVMRDILKWPGREHIRSTREFGAARGGVCATTNVKQSSNAHHKRPCNTTNTCLLWHLAVPVGFVPCHNLLLAANTCRARPLVLPSRTLSDQKSQRFCSSSCAPACVTVLRLWLHTTTHPCEFMSQSSQKHF